MAPIFRFPSCNMYKKNVKNAAERLHPRETLEWARAILNWDKKDSIGKELQKTAATIQRQQWLYFPFQNTQMQHVQHWWHQKQSADK